MRNACHKGRQLLFFVEVLAEPLELGNKPRGVIKEIHRCFLRS